jgi:hypothetical protein
MNHYLSSFLAVSVTLVVTHPTNAQAFRYRASELPAGIRPLSITPSGDVYAVDSNWSAGSNLDVLTVSPNGSTLFRSINASTPIETVRVAPNGTIALVTTATDGRKVVSTIHPDGTQQVLEASGESEPAWDSLTLSSDGMTLAVATYDDVARPSAVVWTPAGRRVVSGVSPSTVNQHADVAGWGTRADGTTNYGTLASTTGTTVRSIPLPDVSGLPALSVEGGTQLADDGKVFATIEAYDDGIYRARAFSFDTSTGASIEMETLTPGISFSRVNAATSGGLAVGYEEQWLDNRSARAVLWEMGAAVDLTAESLLESGWVLNSASLINESGHVVAYGTRDSLGGLEQTRFLLTPLTLVPEPATMAIVVFGTVIGIRRRRE